MLKINTIPQKIASWNPALNTVIEIKQTFINEFGEEELYMVSDAADIEEKWNYIEKYHLIKDEEPLFTIKPTVLGYWVARLVYQSLDYLDYAKIIQPLELTEFNNLLLIKYGSDTDMFESDFWNRYNGLYRECRSVVINYVNENLVLTPFKKFFNLNEQPETQLKLIQERINKAKTIEFSDKLDGSMQSARYYNNKIIMAGSQSLNPKNSWRLEDGYRMLTDKYIEMLTKYPEFTFIFEYISERDAHVVKYDESEEGLYLIGIRECDTGIELNYHEVLDMANRFNIPTTKMFNKTLEEVLSELDDKSSDEAEGFVLNIDGFRVKIKYNDYTQIHRILSKISSINVVIKAVADGIFDDLYAKLPNAHKPRILNLANVVKQYEKDIKSEAAQLYEDALKNTNDIKSFMVYVDKSEASKQIKSLAKCIYTNKPLNILKKNYGDQLKYIKFNEIEKYYEGKAN